MRPSLKALRNRASDAPARVSEKAREAAAGSAPPAGREAAPAAEGDSPGAVERGAMRRRLRRARRMREAILTELGALVMEMHRQGRQDPALVERKAREAAIADGEVRGLARALAAEHTTGQVVTAGIAGACPACGALAGTDDRFCARCGAPLQLAAAAPPFSAAPPAAGTRVELPAAPPPDAGTRVEAPAAASPPDAGERVEAPAPPPDPSTRVDPPEATEQTVVLGSGGGTR